METRSMARRRRIREADVVTKTNNNFIDNLPDECLFHIFSFLPVENRLCLTAVCKRWRNFGSEAWRDVRKLDLISLEGIEKSFRAVTENNTTVVCVDENCAEPPIKFKTNYPRLFSLCAGSLKDLTIPVPEGSDIIRVVTKNCQGLKKFRLRFEYFSNRAEHCRDLAKLFAKNKGTLRHVVVDNMQETFAHHAHCLFELSDELIELQLWGFKAHVAPYGETPITPLENVFQNIIFPIYPALRRLKNVQILVLNGLQLRDDHLRMIENFENLKHLEIYKSGGGYFNPTAISRRRNLESLSLNGAKTTDNPWFETFVSNNPDLKHLKLQCCQLTTESNKKLFELSNLETLSLKYLYDYDSDSLDLSGFHNLKKFVCTEYEDSAVIQLLETASALEFLDLTVLWHRGPNSSRILRKAHSVVRRRVNKIPLHIVIDSYVIQQWKRPKRLCKLLTVESSVNFAKRIGRQYKGYEVERFY